jgi:hypothetical protein
MGSANTSDQDAKVLRGYDCLRCRKECHLTVELFGDPIELRMRGERFEWMALRSEVCLPNKTDRDTGIQVSCEVRPHSRGVGNGLGSDTVSLEAIKCN